MKKYMGPLGPLSPLRVFIYLFGVCLHLFLSSEQVKASQILINDLGGPDQSNIYTHRNPSEFNSGLSLTSTRTPASQVPRHKTTAFNPKSQNQNGQASKNSLDTRK